MKLRMRIKKNQRRGKNVSKRDKRRGKNVLKKDKEEKVKMYKKGQSCSRQLFLAF